MDWTEIVIKVATKDTDTASAVANMAVPYGIYVEDYSELEKDALEIAHIDLIDEELLEKDRTKSLIHIYISNEDNPFESVAYLKERLSALKIDFEIDTSSISEDEWADNWKKFFKVTEIGERLVIRPSWEEYDNSDEKIVLSIDPGAAFGTGTHATTKMCLEMLERYVDNGTTMLDIGSGSGILSIAASLLGAKNVDGVDIDAMAVKVAAENAEINNVSGNIKFIKGDLCDKIDGKYSIVCANIVADVIITLLKDVKKYMYEDSLFICSGIIDVREDDVLSAFKEFGFSVIEERECENWRAFAVKIGR